MEDGRPGRIGRYAVPSVVRDFKGEIDGVTVPLLAGEDPCARDLMLKEQNAPHPLALVKYTSYILESFVANLHKTILTKTVSTYFCFIRLLEDLLGYVFKVRFHLA